MARAPTATPLTTTMFAKVAAALKTGTMSIQELADELECSYTFVMHTCKALHEQKVAHIAEWRQDSIGRHAIIIYKLGSKKDAVKPVQSNAEKSATYRSKLKRFSNPSLDKVMHNVARQTNY